MDDVPQKHGDVSAKKGLSENCGSYTQFVQQNKNCD